MERIVKIKDMLTSYNTISKTAFGYKSGTILLKVDGSSNKCMRTSTMDLKTIDDFVDELNRSINPVLDKYAKIIADDIKKEVGEFVDGRES